MFITIQVIFNWFKWYKINGFIYTAFAPYALAPNFCASKELLKIVGHGHRAQMDRTISMICALRPTFMKLTPVLISVQLWTVVDSLVEKCLDISPLKQSLRSSVLSCFLYYFNLQRLNSILPNYEPKWIFQIYINLN